MQARIVKAFLQGQRRESFKGKNYFLNFHVIENLCKDRHKGASVQAMDRVFIIYLPFRSSRNTGCSRPNSSKVRRAESEMVTTSESMEATTVMTLIIN